MAAPSAITISNLNHWYGEGNGRRQVLESISLDIRPGEVIFLMGPSGCGKTTVLTLVGGLRSIQEGSVIVCGQELRGAKQKQLLQNRRNIGFVFQHHNLHRSLSVIDNVFMGLEATGQSSDPRAFDRCKLILERVGLSDHLAKRQDQISGGQKQRVAIARALVSNPKVLLADEPTAALDSQTGQETVGLMHALAKDSGASVLIVTHDERILKFADRIIRMEDGRIVPGAQLSSQEEFSPDEPETLHEFFQESLRRGGLRQRSGHGGSRWSW
jgi:putative ABC transport system ATP-binding protein